MIRLSKRIFYSVLIVLLWFGFVVDGAHALFQSTAELGDSSITSSTANLLINNSQTSTPGPFTTSEPGFDDVFVPGQTNSHYIFLKNDASGNVDYDLYLSAAGNTNSQNWMNMVTVELYPVSNDGTVSQQGYEGTVEALSTAMAALDVSLPPGGIQRFLLELTLDQGWQDQGAQFSYGLQFTGIQHTN